MSIYAVQSEESQNPTHYRLFCPGCGTYVEDDGYILTCGICAKPSLLRSVYQNRTFTISHAETGIYRYRAWLPIRRTMAGASGTVTFQSERLSALTGLSNLWIAFNGYWPERGAFLSSSSFKELEAYCVLGRLPAGRDKILTVASAGNTGAAFALACSASHTPCLIFIPERALGTMRFSVPIASCVKVVVIEGDGDYLDATKAAESIASVNGFYLEGGVKNVARRDGLGTVLLSVFEAAGRLPDYYFQAVGSGTGAIAVHETAKRFSIEGEVTPHLYVSQNLPFVPIQNSWRARTRTWLEPDEKRAKHELAQIDAQVLSNRQPPYSMVGGLFDALTESRGEVFGITNEEARSAARLFEEIENIDIEPAAAVAFASLLATIKIGGVPKSAMIVVNITGGGRFRYSTDFNLGCVDPHLVLSAKRIGGRRWIEELLAMF